MRNNDVMIEVNFRDYAEPKATYTKEELLNIIRRIRADVEQTRNQLAIAQRGDLKQWEHINLMELE